MAEKRPGLAKDSQEQKRPTRRTRNGCQHCRLRHLKCDDEEPSCSPCTREGITCIRGLPIRFRHGWNPSITDGKTPGRRSSQSGFDRDQPWCRTNHPLTFVDENRDLLSLYDALSDDDNLDDMAASSVTGSGQPDPISGLIPTVESRVVSSATTLGSSLRAHSATPTSADEASWGEWAHEERAEDDRNGSVTSSVLDPFLAFELSVPDMNNLDDKRLESAASALAVLKYSEPGIDLPPVSLDTTVDPEPAVPLVCSPGNPSRPTSPELSPLVQAIPIWPLQDEMEANLFRYFTDVVSRSFDLCDPERHFALVVPCQAMLYSPLMNAMFALSAKLLSRNGHYDKSVAHRYYQKCLTTFRPMLWDEAALMDENLFAATVILRHFEEVDVPLSGADTDSHLLGNSLFVKAAATLQESAGLSAPFLLTGLRRAAFLVAVRQEIYTAFVSQRSIDPSFGPLVINPSLDVAANDHDWANRAVFLLADALRLCFDDKEVMSADMTRYDKLVEYAREWYEKKPLSLCPIYYRDPSAAFYASGTGDAETSRTNEHGNQFFPDVWLMSDAATTGLQHYHLARILLLAFNPRAPRIGPNRAAFAKNQGQCLREEVKMLVGIAKSNPHCRPNYVSACMGIAAAGERFEGLWEQKNVMNFLEETESICAWPTVTAKEHLSTAWGWAFGETQPEGR